MNMSFLYKLFNTVFLIHFVISLLFTILLFNALPADSFYFLHDEFIILNKDEAIRSFFVQNPLDFGSVNTTIIIVSFFERLYYLIGYYLESTIFILQPLLYFLKFLILFFVPYIGFKKIQSQLLNSDNHLLVILISFWFSINSYTVIFWHGNAFALTILIAYALCPLSYYLFYQSVFGNRKLSYKIAFCLIFFIQSFALYLVAAFVLFVLLIAFVLLITHTKKWLTIKHLLSLIILYLPFLSLSGLVIGEMISSQAVTVNSVGGETYLSLQGSFLYPLLMWYSWAIYTEWSPRSIYVFNDFFRSIPYLLSPIIIYGLIIYSLIMKKMSIIILGFLLCFLFFLFFIKGAQEPFGYIYSSLLHYVPPFRVFRSPDTKFSPMIIFSLCMLLVYLLSNSRGKIDYLIKQRNARVAFLSGTAIFLVVLIQGYPLFNGVAIKGINSKTSNDRLITIPKPYKEVASYINTSTEYEYILPIPPTDFANFRLAEGEIHSGQDLLPKLTKLPFVYISDYSGMTRQAYQLMETVLKSNDKQNLGIFPIKYVLLRSDVEKNNKFLGLEELIKNNFKQVFTNSLFSLYDISEGSKIIEGVDYFEMVNPTFYKVLVSKNSEIVLKQNYNNNWKLYESEEKAYIPILTDLKYLFKSSVAESNVALGYANGWKIENLSNDKNSYILYFQKQAIFYLGIIVSFTYFFLLILILLAIKKYESKKNK